MAYRKLRKLRDRLDRTRKSRENYETRCLNNLRTNVINKKENVVHIYSKGCVCRAHCKRFRTRPRCMQTVFTYNK